MFFPTALLLALAAPAHPSPTTSAVGPVALGGDVDGFVVGHVALGAGAGLTALSTAAFVTGFDIERQLRSAPHDRGVVDALLLRRTIAAGVAWPAAALAVAGIGVGVVALALDPVRDPPLETP